MKPLSLSPHLRRPLLIVLLIYSLFWFVFALLSGAELYGGGLVGIIKNSPNALPWAVLLAFNLSAWKHPRPAGFLILLFCLFFFFFNHMWRHLAMIAILLLPLFFVGLGLVALPRNKSTS